ncbi:unnamed protein product [Zymoseptoria tritici ST99CH_1A5]|uniref:Uncharacterized protein n=1 Tax=Zymoseptoria tritici ST99CH_1A5 TaxID=1276529 RepID=A0A1Y6LTY8_ZYMTR|nr:unnamed protein product [Zymoseptoria tritici ST99CH_1A5]
MTSQYSTPKPQIDPYLLGEPDSQPFKDEFLDNTQSLHAFDDSQRTNDSQVGSQLPASAQSQSQSQSQPLTDDEKIASIAADAIALAIAQSQAQSQKQSQSQSYSKGKRAKAVNWTIAMETFLVTYWTRQIELNNYTDQNLKPEGRQHLVSTLSEIAEQLVA